MLHIHNGDSSANIAKQSSLPGEHLAWRESLITGPTPAGVGGNEWRSVRAQHLSKAYGVNLQECERGLLDQEKKLSSFAEHEEVVLWFEHDLFCQTNLLYLLNWFAQEDTVVAVTAGALKLLSRDELQGVIGHEFSHILNGDMRLNLRLTGLIHGIVCISIIGSWLLRSIRYSGRSSGRGNSKPPFARSLRPRSKLQLRS